MMPWSWSRKRERVAAVHTRQHAQQQMDLGPLSAVSKRLQAASIHIWSNWHWHWDTVILLLRIQKHMKYIFNTRYTMYIHIPPLLFPILPLLLHSSTVSQYQYQYHKVCVCVCLHFTFQWLLPVHPLPLPPLHKTLLRTVRTVYTHTLHLIDAWTLALLDS